MAIAKRTALAHFIIKASKLQLRIVTAWLFFFSWRHDLQIRNQHLVEKRKKKGQTYWWNINWNSQLLYLLLIYFYLSFFIHSFISTFSRWHQGSDGAGFLRLPQRPRQFPLSRGISASSAPWFSWNRGAAIFAARQKSVANKETQNEVVLSKKFRVIKNYANSLRKQMHFSWWGKIHEVCKAPPEKLPRRRFVGNNFFCYKNANTQKCK